MFSTFIAAGYGSNAIRVLAGFTEKENVNLGGISLTYRMEERAAAEYRYDLRSLRRQRGDTAKFFLRVIG